MHKEDITWFDYIRITRVKHWPVHPCQSHISNPLVSPCVPRSKSLLDYYSILCLDVNKLIGELLNDDGQTSQQTNGN